MGRRLCVGVILGAHGIKGAVRIKSFTERPADLTAYGALEGEDGKKRFSPRLLAEANGVVTARLDGVDTRDAAEALKGVRLMLDRAALPEPEDEAFYVSDLVGLAAEGIDGRSLGRVTAVFDFGAGDILEIGGDAMATLLVPFTKAAVPLVDVEVGRVVVDPPAEVEGEAAGDEDGG